MCTITFEEVVCRRLVETNDKYRLVVGISEVPTVEFKSPYRLGGTVFGWKPLFASPVRIETSAASLHLSIRLREKGWRGLTGHDICSYALEVVCDCRSTTFELRAINSTLTSAPELSITVTVVGLAGNTPSQTNVDSADSLSAIPHDLPSRSVLSDSSPRAAVGRPDSPASRIAHSLSPAPILKISNPGGLNDLFLSPSLGHSQHRVRDDLHMIQTSHVSPSGPNPPDVRPNDLLLLAAENASKNASREQSSMRYGSHSVTESISTMSAIAPSAEGAGDAMYSGLSRLDAVVQIISVAADIHPLVKGAWSLLNAAYALAKQQSDLDTKIEDLILALDANCEFIRVLTANDLTEVASSIVAKILREVLKGAALIEDYCTIRKSKTSVFRFAGSATSLQVDACLQTLEAFRRHLTGHITAGIQHDLQALSFQLTNDLSVFNAKFEQMDDRMQTKELLDQMRYAPEADRAMRSDERGCLPGTRGEILESVVHWATGENANSPQYIHGLFPNSRVLWLCGVAGSGKSSIAISVAKTLQSKGYLGALYGFETAFQTSLNLTNLFSTIARQRAERRPARKQHLLRTLELMNPDQRATTSTSEQFKAFLTSPRDEYASVPDDVVVIDAFDESGSISTRSAALRALAPEPHDPTFPTGVRFIVTSRYDSDVARRLESVSKGDQVMVSVLQMEDIHPPHTERDIRLYVMHMLGEPYGLDGLQAAESLVRLAMAAEHSFQWASAACRYIADTDDHDMARLPVERLEETLDTRGGLDALYLSVLDHNFRASITRNSSSTQSLRFILGALVFAFEPVSVQIISALALSNSLSQAVDLDSFHFLARQLSSIITGTKDTTTPLVAFHTSFTDFLADETRSQNYAAHSLDVNLRMAFASLAVMTRSLQFNICRLDTSFLRNDQVADLTRRVREHISPELSYACRYWPAHVAVALSSPSADAARLQTALRGFLKQKMLLLEWLEVMSLTGADPWQSLSPVSFLQTDNIDLSDLITFTIYFSTPIRTSVPHIYLSALAFAPSSSLLTLGRARMPSLVRADSPLASWPLVRHILAHKMPVACIAFLPDGHRVVSGEGDEEELDSGGGIGLWDVMLGRTASPRVPTPSAFLSIACSPDGRLIASGHKDGTAQLWDVHSMLPRGDPLVGHGGWVWSVAFSSDSTFLASGSDDGIIRLWDSRTGRSVGKLAGHEDYVVSLAFSPNGSLVASGCQDGTIRFWDIRTLSMEGESLRAHADWLRFVVFSPDGKTLVSCGDDGSLRFWDVLTRSPIRDPLYAHGAYVRSIAFSPDGTAIVSGSEDRTVRVWDVGTGSAVGEPLIGHTNHVVSVAFSPDGALLASGSRDKTIHVWDTRSWLSRSERLATHLAPGLTVAFSPSGMLVSGHQDGSIHMWDLRTFSRGRALTGHSGWVRSITFSPDGALLASGSDECTIRLWDVLTGSEVGKLDGHDDHVLSVAFSPDGLLLASGCNDGTVKLWDVRTRSTLEGLGKSHSGSVWSVTFSPNSQLLASASGDTAIRLWDVNTRSPVGEPLKGHEREVRTVAFSHDGSLLASCSNDLTIRLWDIRSHGPVTEPLRGHSDLVRSLAFSPDGTLLASGSFDHTIRLWNVSTWDPVGEPLTGHTDQVISIAFSPDGAFLASTASDATVRIWDVGSILSRCMLATLDSPAPSALRPLDPIRPPVPVISGLPPFRTDFLAQLEDGWVTGPDKELILWIPPSLRSSLSNVHEIARFGDPPLVKLDFAKFVCGVNWAQCYSPTSAFPTNS